MVCPLSTLYLFRVYIGADCVVNSLAIERETCVISSIMDQVQCIPFLECKDLCTDIRKAFPGLASIIDSIESALATTIAEDLKEDNNDGNLLDLGSYANCIHIPTLDECIMPEEVLIQLDYIVPKVSLQLHDFKTFSTTGISIHDLFFGQCGDAMLVPHQSMGSEAVLSCTQLAVLGCFAISCPGWTSNRANVKVLPFDHGPCHLKSDCFCLQLGMPSI